MLAGKSGAEVGAEEPHREADFAHEYLENDVANEGREADAEAVSYTHLRAHET